MADVEHTKEPIAATTHTPEVIDEKAGISAPYSESEPAGPLVLPDGWMYRQRKIGSWAVPWYASPKVQLVMVAFVCFLCPGMFNALGGMGGGGKADHKLADDMNTALYSTFAAVGFFAGTFVNRLGVKATLAFGGIGYCIYSVALLVSMHVEVRGFSIFAGALLGVCAAFLWTAQGTIMVSYPEEGSKGRYFAWFWAIFNLGGVMGSLIPLGLNINTRTNSDVSDGTYIAFIILMGLGAVLALCLCNASAVHRADGSKVVLKKNPTWVSEFVGLWDTLKTDYYIIGLFPMFWTSNWFTPYQFNAVNGALFDTRTKALNGLLYWTAQIMGALFFGYCLDLEKFRRTVRAKVALLALFVLTMVVWGGGYALQKGYTREDVDPKTSSYVPLDWVDGSAFLGPMFLFMFYGFYDAAWQATAYWFIGALSNSGRKSANFVGFYKGIQSAGAAVMWSLDSQPLPYMNEFASNWALLLLSLLCATPVIFLKVKDHVTVEEDLKGTDETLADVLPAGHAEKIVA